MKNTTARKLAQIQGDGLIIGIDPHKHKHAIVIMTRLNVVCSKFKIGNSRQGFEQLVDRVNIEVNRAGVSGAIFAIEAGGHYWRNLAYYLGEQGREFHLINPFTLKRQREGKDLNRRKTDYRDATVAGELLRNGDFTETRLLEGDYAELRAAHMCRQRLIEQRTRNINLIRGLLDGLFPEFCEVFKDPCGKTAMTVLSSCAVPEVIVELGEDQFIRTVRRANPGCRLAVKKMRALHEAASTSIGVKAGAYAVADELGFLIRMHRIYFEQIDQVEKKLYGLVDKFAETPYLLSVPGLSPLTVAGLIANIGPDENYADAKDLVKLAGVNPIQSESAEKGQRHTPISKKGRSDLRCCLWQAAMSLLRHNDEFRAWAHRMENRAAHANPLHHREVLGAAMNKLLRLYFALVSKRQMYRLAEAA